MGWKPGLARSGLIPHNLVNSGDDWGGREIGALSGPRSHSPQEQC